MNKGVGVSISLVIPIYNQANYIEETTRKYAAAFAASPLIHAFEIILVSNNCSDNAPEICAELAKSIPHVRHFDYPFRTLKGGAVIRGFQHAKFPLLGFTDVDMATTPEEFLKLIPPLISNPRVGAAIASRQMPGAVLQPPQNFFRKALGYGFAFLREQLFHLGVNDSQCGAKLFRKEAISFSLFTYGFAFDVELLYATKQNDFIIKEIPIIWHDRAGTTVRFSTPFWMFAELISLRLALRHRPMNSNYKHSQ